MAIDDPLGKFQEQIEEDLNAPLGKRLASIAVSLLPEMLGSTISVLLTERATKLVTERFRDMARRAISNIILKSLPMRCFRLGRFGSDFLEFISEEQEAEPRRD